MLHIAILGFGTIGYGVADVITQNADLIEKRVGQKVNVKYVLDLRDFPGTPYESLVIHDYNTILNDPEITVVAEMMGGSHPAYDFSKAALEAGKSVVTSNKEVVANFGSELLEIAKAHGVSYLFEASVGGGIPIIRPMRTDLSPEHILSVYGILNGTTNYILTQMKQRGTSFADALSDAQKKGYAEANPAADIEGIDAARKIAILAALAFGKAYPANSFSVEGIASVTPSLLRVADAFEGTVKLIASARKKEDGTVSLMVAPRFVPFSNPLSTVQDVYNGILVSTDMLGETMFYGKGAGRYPTAGAVVSDILEALVSPGTNLPAFTVTEEKPAAEDGAAARLILFPATEDWDALTDAFGTESFVPEGEGVALLSKPMTDEDLAEALKTFPAPLACVRALG